jgi:8-oxo-dGTP diphosphatase
MAPESKTALRYAAKALIIEDGRILCLKKHGDIGTFFVLPGGGQNPGELLPDALLRECMEELGAKVLVGPLRFVQEYIGDNHDFRKVHKGRHFVNHYFECRLLERPETHALSPDDGQVGLEWLEISKLTTTAFFPRVLAARLAEKTSENHPVYLGDSV